MSGYDKDSAADQLIEGATGLVRQVLRKHALGVVGGLRELYEQIQAVKRERDNARHVLATVICNLENGARPKDVLRWWEEEGRELSTKSLMKEVGDD